MKDKQTQQRHVFIVTESQHINRQCITDKETGKNVCSLNFAKSQSIFYLCNVLQSSCQANPETNIRMYCIYRQRVTAPPTVHMGDHVIQNNPHDLYVFFALHIKSIHMQYNL